MSNRSKSKLNCFCCGQQPDSFLPLPKEYLDFVDRAGFQFSINRLEMLNVKSYFCNKCGATDRDRFIAFYLNQNKQLIWNRVVVDFAPSASLSKFLKNANPSRYTSVDKFMEGVDINADLTDLKGIESNSIDLIICSHVLEHIEDDRKALSEMFRILKQGGQAILVVPIPLELDHVIEGVEANSDEERWKIYGQNDHVRVYDRETFKLRIREAKFSLKTFSGWWSLWGGDYNKNGFLRSFKIYIGVKVD